MFEALQPGHCHSVKVLPFKIESKFGFPPPQQKLNSVEKPGHHFYYANVWSPDSIGGENTFSSCIMYYRPFNL